MSELHKISKPSELDLYRENQGLRQRVHELEAQLSAWKVCVEHVTEPSEGKPYPTRLSSSSEGWTMMSSAYANHLLELEGQRDLERVHLEAQLHSAQERAEKAEAKAHEEHTKYLAAKFDKEAAEADRDALKKERNAALSLAEQRGAAYDIADGLRREAEADRDAALHCIQNVRERVEMILANWMRPPGGQQAGVPDKSISPQTCRDLLRTLDIESGRYSYEEWLKLTAERDGARRASQGFHDQWMEEVGARRKAEADRDALKRELDAAVEFHQHALDVTYTCLPMGKPDTEPDRWTAIAHRMAELEEHDKSFSTVMARLAMALRADRDALREAASALLADYEGVEDMLPRETAEKVFALRRALAASEVKP
jgi:hypothetical protein